MRRFLTLTGTVLLAVAVLLAGTPAQAGEVSWADETDEATTVAQATIDITKVTLSFDGKTFKSVLDIKQLGEPMPFGTGQFFLVEFKFGEAEYNLTITQDRLVGDSMQFQSSEPAPGGQSNTVTTIACKTCKFKLDFDKSQVEIQIGWESLTSSLRKLAPGGSIEAVTARTGPAYSEPSGQIFTSPTFLWGTTPGDSTTHPEDPTFTF